MMRFSEAEAYLYDLGVDAMKGLAPSLHRIEALCAALDHPERVVPAIHVTGTNGKTSTVRITSSILAATGLKVGTYTSPHLETIRERISRAGEAISEEEFAATFEHLFPFVELVEGQLQEKLSFFEILTAMFFLWAAEGGVDAIVVEVGLGGRWDATNVVPAPVSVITNIGLDHVQLLGAERSSIADEKAGIVKPGSVVVSAERSPDSVDIIAGAARKAGAETSFIDRQWRVLDNSVAVGGRYISIETTARAYDGLFVPLHGAHQGVNAATAVEAVGRFVPTHALEEDLVQQGLNGGIVPGRLETFHGGHDRPTVVLDVAHNPDGLSALVKALVGEFAFERAHFVMGFLSDKDHEGMLVEASRVASSLVLTEPQGVRATPVDELKQAAGSIGVQSVAVKDARRAFDTALDRAEPADLVCVTGSHYLVGELRGQLRDW